MCGFNPRRRPQPCDVRGQQGIDGETKMMMAPYFQKSYELGLTPRTKAMVRAAEIARASREDFYNVHGYNKYTAEEKMKAWAKHE